jgi:hypothetical protein
MLLPLGTYLCRLSRRLLHPLGTVSAFAFLCIQRYTDNAAHAMETNIDTGACLGSYAGNYAGRIPKYSQVAPYHKMRNA